MPVKILLCLTPPSPLLAMREGRLWTFRSWVLMNSGLVKPLLQKEQNATLGLLSSWTSAL